MVLQFLILAVCNLNAVGTTADSETLPAVDKCDPDNYSDVFALRVHQWHSPGWYP